EPGGARLCADTVDADLIPVADLSSAPRAIPTAFGRAAVVPVGLRVHAGVVARDERARTGDDALAAIADFAGVTRRARRATAFAAAFGRAAVVAVGVGIDARSVAFDETRLAGKRTRSS